MLVGVDIGGTFTDFIYSKDGKLEIHKRLSTPHNPAEAMLAGLGVISPDGLQFIQQVAHGSTVATNAILERKGAKIALIATQGFRDVLAIGRQNRPDLYARAPQLPPPLIPRERCYEVPERMDHQGNVLMALDMKALDRVLDEIHQQQVDAVVVCLLYSYINPAHEEKIRQRMLEKQILPEWRIVLSTDVLPQFREFERASTTALEAYVRPKMAQYIDDLVAHLPETTSLRVMKSDGGVMNASRVREQAIQTALSGPAAGVLGAFHLAKLAGYDHIITLDMGGTSTDVALCPGALRFATNSQVDGIPLRARMLDIETIGAGGGSIARLDAGGALRVGPESAGADPGPIVYGRGGQSMTVSDANALLGRLDADHFLGGAMHLKLEPAQTAIQPLAHAMQKDVTQTAKGIIDIANINIDRAVRRVSVARGYDPREFTLVAFGGAGPLHACEVAQQLDMGRVLIPRYPGVLCAMGLLVADVRVDHSLPVLVRATRGLIARLRAMQAEILATGRADLRREGIADEDMEFDVLLDMRYLGQAHELTVPFGANVIDDFHQAHANAYGHFMEDRPVEIVNMRLQAVGKIPNPEMVADPVQSADPAPAYLGTKPSPLGGEMALYDREKLPIGARFKGEALIFQLDSTVYIPVGWSALVDSYRNLILER